MVIVLFGIKNTQQEHRNRWTSSSSRVTSLISPASVVSMNHTSEMGNVDWWGLESLGMLLKVVIFFSLWIVLVNLFRVDDQSTLSKYIMIKVDVSNGIVGYFLIYYEVILFLAFFKLPILLYLTNLGLSGRECQLVISS